MESIQEKVRDSVGTSNVCLIGVLGKKERGKVIHRDKGWEFFQTVGRHQSTDCRCIVNFKQDKVREKHAWCLQSKTV